MLYATYRAMKNFHYVNKIQRYAGIDETGVTYIDKDGHEQKVKADLIVLASGAVGKPEESAAFYGAGDHTHYIGDCYRVGHVRHAMAAGFAVGNQI
jgi:hypothetical protein